MLKELDKPIKQLDRTEERARTLVLGATSFHKKSLYFNSDTIPEWVSLNYLLYPLEVKTAPVLLRKIICDLGIKRDDSVRTILKVNNDSRFGISWQVQPDYLEGSGYGLILSSFEGASLITQNAPKSGDIRVENVLVDLPKDQRELLTFYKYRIGNQDGVPHPLKVRILSAAVDWHEKLLKRFG